MERYCVSGLLSSQREQISWPLLSSDTQETETCPVSVDRVYLMRTRRSESQEPFSPSCLSAWPSWFLAAGSGFLGPRARTHSESQQLWDYSGFIDLSNEPQTCCVGAGPEHPGGCSRETNGFHTSSNAQ